MRSQNVAFRQSVINYNAWQLSPKPYLILTVGSEHSSDYWRGALNNNKRGTFIDNLIKVNFIDEIVFFS